ncbi:lytic transglycosylase domain-containing protein [Sphingosinicella sp. BN140058]|uniref:lytic transglycosylase domain-containing protein n=1 Tax=Sphingosinicella sp. BN140058 TaxID=1892855 RepID=UPI001012A971|nr:lytic transglycosylase domain-containing protein [Sphingosinicella sp. BN140058]
MQKKLALSGLLGVSAASLAAVATGVPQMNPARVLPAAVQTAAAPAVVRPALPPAPPPRAYVPAAIDSALSRWNALRQSDNLPFSSYASFLASYRGWPGETAMRRSAEKAINDATPASEVLNYFRLLPPVSNTGQAKLAFGLLNSGQPDAARAAARTAWIGGTLSDADEFRILSLFGASLTPQDHDARVDRLLADGALAGARRSLGYASAAQRPMFEARLALQSRAPDAATRVSMLSGYEGHAGLIQDRANYLRSSGQSIAARQLLATARITTRPANPETWLETLLTNARAAANDGQWSTAYDIAARADDSYPAGTDVSARPYGERDAYTSLVWLGGNAALNKLARHADAARMFDRYARAAKSPQTRSKGFYWGARAAYGAGQQALSDSLLQQAAASPDQYYGQLALERLGRRVTPPAQPAFLPTAADRATFANRPLVQATKALGDLGRWSDQSLFVRALADELDSDQERILAGEFGRSIGRLDLGVWVARQARNSGANFYAPSAFPEVTLPASYSHQWSLAHGITRQESSFDRAAVSHADARGMMQLMPGTAREQARKVGLPYDLGRLTSDPSYNVMLGTSYFQRLLDQWGGNVPMAVASYNAGAGNVAKWVRQNGDPRAGADIVRWIEDIPYSETRNYVQRVLENAVVYDAIRAQRSGGSGNRLSFYLGKAGAG